MKVSAYKMGTRVSILDIDNPGSAILEVTLDDGRTVQLVVESTGLVFLRGWGNVPAKLGNCNLMGFSAQLQKEKQTHCEKCYGKLDSNTSRGGCTCK